MPKPVRAIALLVCVLLCGCGKPTPLNHALQAFRAGDFAEFTIAEAEETEALKTAIQPGADLCRVSAADIAKYHAMHVIEDLNRAALFQRPEEQRLVYALAVAGKHSRIWPGSFLADAPIANSGGGAIAACRDNGEAMTAMREGASYMQQDDEGRMNLLQDWIKALQAKHGKAFDSEMRAAAGKLLFGGVKGSWPPDVDFGEFAVIPTFDDLRKQLNGH